jgi:CubicO group peptidase (beta-lactamase class C family)
MKGSKMKLLTSLISFLILFSVVIADDNADEIDKLLQMYVDYGQFNGSVLVAEKGNIIYKKGFGYANMEWEIPNTTATKFRLASVSKQFTATLIMQLVEEGKIKLDGKLSSYLPYYRKDTGEKVTIHQLLTHTSGIPSYTNRYGGQLNRLTLEADSLVIKYCSDSLEFEPGSQFRYNNSGYAILGAIIEHVSEKSYQQVLQEKIFEPLGMKNSGYDNDERLLANRASGYAKDFSGYRNASFLDMSVPYAAGALYSTVEDLYLWDRGLYANKILKQSSLEKMFTPEMNHYGYGWGIYYLPSGDEDSVKSVAHSGGINGFSTRIMRILKDQHLIVALANVPNSILPAMVEKIAAILYKQPYEMPKKMASDELANILFEEGVEAAEKRYREMRDNEKDAYRFNENQFNNLGYVFLRSGKNAEAIAVFKFNVENHPESANVYDSLAEAYMKDGQNKEAIANYEKTLEILDNDQRIPEAFRERLRTGAEHSLQILYEQQKK